MYFPFPLISLLCLLHSALTLSLPLAPNPPQPPTTTYLVPNSQILLRLTAIPNSPHRIPPASLTNLISTGTAALDILASRAGGPTARLDVPRIRWAISGLAIQTSDATRVRPETGGGPFRFDELKTAYEGVGVGVGMVGGVECTFGIWRVEGRVVRRRVKGLGWGTVKVAELVGMEGNGNLSVGMV
ncbi:MAG: hypothetical protein Q9219_003774 [cf. Caloplaca sp. 3 TL-2023]